MTATHCEDHGRLCRKASAIVYHRIDEWDHLGPGRRLMPCQAAHQALFSQLHICLALLSSFQPARAMLYTRHHTWRESWDMVTLR